VVRLPVGATDFSHLRSVRAVSLSRPASYILGTGESFLGVKLSGRETDHLSPVSAEFKNEGGYSSTPPIHLHSVRRENFNFASIRASHSF
jgi:hypothetical protein